MLKSKVLISVVIPLYNAEEFISKTIESVINQTYQNWELLIVDDCSIDDSRGVVESYALKDERINLIQSEVNFGGPAKPRNIGASRAKGKYIAFLDADDVWCQDKLLAQLEFMIEGKYAFSSTAISRIDEDSKDYQNNLNSLKRDNRIARLPEGDIPFELFKENFITLSSVMIESHNFEPFQEYRGFIAVEDYQLWLRLITKKDCKYGMLAKTLVNYRVLPNSISHINRLKQGMKTLFVLCDFLISNNYRELKYYRRLLLNTLKICIKSILYK